MSKSQFRKVRGLKLLLNLDSFDLNHRTDQVIHELESSCVQARKNVHDELESSFKSIIFLSCLVKMNQVELSSTHF